MRRGVSCVVLCPFDLLLYFISAHLHLSSLSLLPLLALYLINLFSRAYPASSFFVLSCLVLRHTCSLSISSPPSLLYLIYQLYLGLTLLPLISLLASESLSLSSIVLWCLCVVLCCLVGHSFARLSISRYILSLVYLLLQASLLSRTIAFFSLLDYLSSSLSVSTVSRVLTLCCLSLYRFSFVLSPSSHL